MRIINSRLHKVSQQTDILQFDDEQEEFPETYESNEVPEETTTEVLEQDPETENNEEGLPTFYINDVTLEDDLDEYQEGFGDEVEYPEMEPESPEGTLYPDFPDKASAANYADENNEVVWIDYTTKSGRKISRNIEPHGMFRAKTGNNILVAFDENANDIRAFIVGRISDIKFLGRKFNDKFVFVPK